MVTTNEGIFLRAIVAQPATYMLVAVGAACRWAGALAAARPPAGRSPAPGRTWRWSVLAVALVVMEGDAHRARPTLIDWPSRPEARNIYNHNLVAAVAVPARDAPSGTHARSASRPSIRSTITTRGSMRYVTGRDDRAVRWFDGRGASSIPAGEARRRPVCLFDDDAAPPDPASRV